jgi:hypothetical protein
MDPGDFAALASVSRDEHGHVELADLDLGRALKEEVLRRLAPYDVVPTSDSRILDSSCDVRIPYRSIWNIAGISAVAPPTS